MFEIPDDDDNFWEDIPLEDITNENKSLQSTVTKSTDKRQLRDCVTQGANKKRCLDRTDCETACNPREVTDKVPSPKEPTKRLQGLPAPCFLQSSQNSTSERESLQTGFFVPNTQNFISKQSSANNSTTEHAEKTDVQKTYPGNCAFAAIKESHERHNNVHQEQSPVSRNSNIIVSSKKRKRKFPGPAGLLPELAHGQTLDSPDLVKTKPVSKSPDQIHIIQATQVTSTFNDPSRALCVGQIHRDDVILSSQSSEDIFNDLPWQTLLKDLGREGQLFLNKFSIMNSLQKAKKKQLPKGKVPLMMAAIETLDWPGTDASVCLRDKSGRIHGTVHQNVMKEHELQFQPGSAVVLRQVSVISPTSRNHYLNITPCNVACVYSNKGAGHNKLSDVPLTTLLRTLDQEVQQDILHHKPGSFCPRTPQTSHGGGLLKGHLPQPSNSSFQADTSVGTSVCTPQRKSLPGHVYRTPQHCVNRSYNGSPQLNQSNNRTSQVHQNNRVCTTPTPDRNMSVVPTPQGNRSFIRTPNGGTNLQVGLVKNSNVTQQSKPNQSFGETSNTGPYGIDSNRNPMQQTDKIQNQMSTPICRVDNRLNGLRTPVNTILQSVSTNSSNNSTVCIKNSVSNIQTPSNQTVTSSKFKFKSQSLSASTSTTYSKTSGNSELKSVVPSRLDFSNSSFVARGNEGSNDLNNNNHSNRFCSNSSINQSVIVNKGGAGYNSSEAGTHTKRVISLNSKALVTGEKDRDEQTLNIRSTPCIEKRTVTSSENTKSCDTPKNKWSFKSKKKSPDIFKSSDSCMESLSEDVKTPVANISIEHQNNKTACVDVDSLWQDDLSDDLLSQLSDDM